MNAAKAPAAVSVNGLPLPGSNWSYNSGQHLITLTSLPAGTVLVQFGRT